jgi:hypothetical protein
LFFARSGGACKLMIKSALGETYISDAPASIPVFAP